MLKFLIQTIDGEVVHDFAFELLRAIEYHKWRGDEMEFEFLDLHELWMVKIHNEKNYLILQENAQKKRAALSSATRTKKALR